MIKNPTRADTKILNGEESDSQPNGVDLRVKKIYTYSPTEDYFLLSEDKKHKRTLVEAPQNGEGYYVLDSGYYVVEMNDIAVGESETGWVLPRSTLMRNGLMVFTALYDSNYHGPMCAGLQVFAPRAFIKPGTRIAQYVCVDADPNGSYNGQYQNGTKII